MADAIQKRSDALPLKTKLTCPHCWHEFRPYEILWVAAHPELPDDPRLVAGEKQRFLPTRFTVEGRAIDVKGSVCQQLACPECHLLIPRSMLESEPLFLSILGAPSSGKSYLLASMTWQLRKTLDKYFRLSFTDADPASNMVLNHYEETLFLNPNENDLTTLRKTEKEGELYESVQLGGRVAYFPKPFVFSVQPQQQHPQYADRKEISRSVCLYDNAGEHFMPGGDAGGALATRHLAISRALLFLFDPTQHPRFRKACQGKTHDPQMGKVVATHRQDAVLHEAASRVRQHTGLSSDERYDRPLIVAVTKFDAWMSLVGNKPLDKNWVIHATREGAHLDLKMLSKLSGQVRSLLQQHAPEVVSAAEGFCQDVTYVPVSALGHPPEYSGSAGAQGMLGIRPRDIKPQWAEIPMVYALYRATEGLIGASARTTPIPPPRSRRRPPAPDDGRPAPSRRPSGKPAAPAAAVETNRGYASDKDTNHDQPAVHPTGPHEGYLSEEPPEESALTESPPKH